MFGKIINAVLIAIDIRAKPIDPEVALRAKRAAARKHAKRPADRFDRRSYYSALRYAMEKAFGMPSEYREPYGDRLAKTDTPEERAAKLQRRRERNRLRAAWHREHGFSAHALRHTSATSLRKSGGLTVAQVQLGHVSQRTSEIYAEADVERAAEVVEQIG